MNNIQHEQRQEHQARIESQQRGQVQHEPQYLDDVPDSTFSLGATDWPNRADTLRGKRK